jgi:hypothetical protein
VAIKWDDVKEWKRDGEELSFLEKNGKKKIFWRCRKEHRYQIDEIIRTKIRT